MKKIPNYRRSVMVATCLVVIPSVAQAALTLSAITDAAAVDDSSGVDFSGQSVTTGLNNWGRSDNFSNANLTNTIITLNGGNQPFLFVNITGADFTGATFNWTPFTSTAGGDIGQQRFNIFRDSTVTGANFSDTVWNISLTGTGLSVTQFFENGAGATDLASAGDAVSFAGADFNFSGSESGTLNDDAANIIINNLGSTGTGATAFGAKYDDAFVNNNFADFGYGSAALLEVDLVSNGWQAVPEPSSTALLGLGALGLIARRRRA